MTCRNGTDVLPCGCETTAPGALELQIFTPCPGIKPSFEFQRDAGRRVFSITPAERDRAVLEWEACKRHVAAQRRRRHRMEMANDW